MSQPKTSRTRRPGGLRTAPRSTRACSATRAQSHALLGEVLPNLPDVRITAPERLRAQLVQRFAKAQMREQFGLDDDRAILLGVIDAKATKAKLRSSPAAEQADGPQAVLPVSNISWPRSSRSCRKSATTCA